MRTARNFKIPSLALAATVSAVFGFVFSASAKDVSYLVDLNTKRGLPSSVPWAETLVANGEDRRLRLRAPPYTTFDHNSYWSY